MNITFRNTRGVTLLELLIAIGLFLIMATGIGYMFHMAVPTQRALHMNALTNDIYKIAYLFKQDLLNTTEIVTPVAPTGGTPTTSGTLVLKVSLTGGNQRVEYRTDGTKPVQIQRCAIADTGTACLDTDFEDLFSEWDDGYVSLIGTTSLFTRGVNADGSSGGTLSDRENNIIRIVLVMGQNEGRVKVSGTATEVSRRTFVLEVLPGGVSPGRTPL